ncbi:AAA+ ATPase domain-containing protein [Cynara cardunculus var. scolymus]|uniref:AAA+ ATPase domain-containing protein n=1 Tax=Cynara cardunculus var. scolymus TaxID=59895 RepID=A0A103YCR8_CYNCS|nr:AAA+ ATPase domain-containing protein [Cynara cardunculus var. scolymus]
MSICCSSYSSFYNHHFPFCYNPNSFSISTLRTIKPIRFAKCTPSDDIHELLKILPHDLRNNLVMESKRDQLLEVILDLGRLPVACFLGDSGRRYLRDTEDGPMDTCAVNFLKLIVIDKQISIEELEYAQNALGEIGGDNRAGIAGTLHRISAVRSRKGVVVGLTCRVGRAVRGHIDMVRDLLQFGESILFIGRPGVGKTTVMREISRVVVDTSNEIGGGGDIPHPAIGSARRMQVSKPSMQHKVMIEAVENHMPQVIIVDEISTWAEVKACKSIAKRGVMLIGSAHGERLGNIIKNPVLSDLAGGVETVTLGDHEARKRDGRKSQLNNISLRPGYRPSGLGLNIRYLWLYAGLNETQFSLSFRMSTP